MSKSQWCRCRKGFGLLFAAALAAVCAGQARANSLSFTDPLTAPNSHISQDNINNGEFSYTAAGLKRTGSSVSTAHDGSDRKYVKTASGEYLTGNFVFELSVQTSIDDIIYIGAGEAAPNPSFHNEATNSVLFRIHNGIAQQIDAAAASGFSGWPFGSNIGSIASYVNGEKLRVRIERNGDSLTLLAKGGSKTFSISQHAPFLNNSNTYLFLGNTKNGAVFSDFTVVWTPPVTYSWVASGFGGCSLSCGGGIQTQTVTCTGSDTTTDPSGAKCAPAQPPPNNQSCNTQPCDTDGDGVNDTSDTCPGTPSGSAVNSSGCSGAQSVALACPTAGAYKNHGAYVSCVSKAAEAAMTAGLLTSAQKDAIVSEAAKSSIGK